MAPTGNITLLLHEWRKGNREAESELFEIVFPHLRRVAHFIMMAERKGHSLQATELVDEAYVRLVAAKDRDWQHRGHFFAIAGRIMRRHVIDIARARPDAQFISLEGIQNIFPANVPKLDLAITVDRLLDLLAETHPEWCTLVEQKYFLGQTDEEAADAMGLKLRTMQRMWLDVRMWLFDHTEPGAEPGPEPKHAAQSAGR